MPAPSTVSNSVRAVSIALRPWNPAVPPSSPENLSLPTWSASAFAPVSLESAASLRAFACKSKASFIFVI